MISPTYLKFSKKYKVGMIKFLRTYLNDSSYIVIDFLLGDILNKIYELIFINTSNIKLLDCPNIIGYYTVEDKNDMNFNSNKNSQVVYKIKVPTIFNVVCNSKKIYYLLKIKNSSNILYSDIWICYYPNKTDKKWFIGTKLLKKISEYYNIINYESKINAIIPYNWRKREFCTLNHIYDLKSQLLTFPTLIKLLNNYLLEKKLINDRVNFILNIS